MDVLFFFFFVSEKVSENFLYVAGEDAAKQEGLVREVGVTHIINCAGPQCPNYLEYVSKSCLCSLVNRFGGELEGVSRCRIYDERGHRRCSSSPSHLGCSHCQALRSSTLDAVWVIEVVKLYNLQK